MAFVDLSSLGYASSAQQLYATWLTYMQAQYPSYVPAAANPENVQALAFCDLAADVTQVGVVVPDAIFRAFGTKLANVVYQTGVAALANIQVTASDTLGHTLPAGTSLTIGPFGFSTLTTLTIPNGASIGTVNAQAVAPGVAFNGATNPTAFAATFDWVNAVTALAPASGGIDPEDDLTFQNRLSSLLKLQAPRPITAGDYATMALSFPPAPGTDQQQIGRATAIDGYLKAAASFTVTLNATTTATVTAAPGTGITAAQGATITGTNIPANTIVQSATTNTIILSNAATGSGSITATVGGTLGNQRTVTVGATDALGTQWGGGSPATDTLNALQTWLASFREVNFNVNVIAPTYTPVYLTVSVHLLPGFDPTVTAASIQSAVIAALSPALYNLPPFGDASAWLQGTTIYYSRLMAIIQQAGGGAVDHVIDGSLLIGTAPSPTSQLDLVLPGPIALPTSTSSTVTVTVV